MSSLVVPVAKIDHISPHPNADNLELIHVLGWQLVVLKNQYILDSKIVYFPPDTVLPLELSERFGVTKYLSKQRIKCVKLRGEPSFGLAVKPDKDEWELGENVAEYYGVTKYEPPLRFTANDALIDHPLFPKYTDIENLRNFPDVLETDEMIVVTEKIHGTSARIGLIEGEWMAGSHQLRRKRPDESEHGMSSLYWYPFQLGTVQNLLEIFARAHRQVILYGEIYGPKIQSFHYGVKAQELGFRAFDLLIDGKYVDWDTFHSICEGFDVQTVPEVARIPFALDEVKHLSKGKTLLMESDAHIREGVVVKPLIERTDPKVGRVILKYVSDSYLFKEKTDYAEK